MQIIYEPNVLETSKYLMTECEKYGICGHKRNKFNCFAKSNI